jgi:hypothetical protein
MGMKRTAKAIADALKPDFDCLDQSLDQDASEVRLKYDHIDASLSELRAKLGLNMDIADDARHRP